MPSGYHLSLPERRLCYHSHIILGNSAEYIHNELFYGREDVITFKYLQKRCRFFREASWFEVSTYINVLKSRHPRSIFKLGPDEVRYIKQMLDDKRNSKLQSLTNKFIDEFYAGK